MKLTKKHKLLLALVAFLFLKGRKGKVPAQIGPASQTRSTDTPAQAAARGAASQAVPAGSEDAAAAVERALKSTLAPAPE